MFFGEYQHTLDEKNRFVLPSRFRDVFDSGQAHRFFMTRGFDECLALYLEDEWASEIKKMKEKPYQKKDVRAFQRLLYSRTIEIVCDKQGRILIPEKFKESAGIAKDIVCVGIENKIEIWDKEKWQKFNDAHLDDFEKIAEELFENHEVRSTMDEGRKI
ncbi:division/cell wall cluster transcriptional repressor MraZ [bacterium]|nr:division/cell wall cluster transcriptional repressor MraZ [bacterium]